MKNRLKTILAATTLVTALSGCGLNGGKPSIEALEKGFKNIPDSVQTAVYWYWISDNISKEGVVKDLEAMKKVGINRAFLGSMGIDGRAGHRNRYLQQPRMEPVGRPLGKAGAGDALPDLCSNNGKG